MVRCHNSGLEATPKGSLYTLNNPLLVFNCTKFFASLVQLKLLECSLKVNFIEYCVPADVINSTVGKGWCAISICVLTVGLYSPQIRTPPSFLGTGTSGVAHLTD